MHPGSGERRRFRAAILCLLLAFGAEALAFRGSELRARCRALFTFAAMGPEEARLHGTSFAADRRLAPFLRAVASATPPTATVALSFASDEGDPRTYLAAFELAPRRVVGFARLSEADFAAGFLEGPARTGGPGERGTSLPFGELVRLR